MFTFPSLFIFHFSLFFLPYYFPLFILMAPITKPWPPSETEESTLSPPAPPSLSSLLSLAITHLTASRDALSLDNLESSHAYNKVGEPSPVDA